MWTRIAKRSAAILIHAVVAIAIFNLMGAGLAAHIACGMYFWGMVIMLEEFE